MATPEAKAADAKPRGLRARAAHRNAGRKPPIHRRAGAGGAVGASMIGLDYARTMARYNRWMNRALYDCSARLTDAQRKEDVGAFFKSLHGTLNHILVGDNVWMGRFVGPIFVPTSRAQELHVDFGKLRRAREAMDARILDWAGALTPEKLAG